MGIHLSWCQRFYIKLRCDRTIYRMKRVVESHNPCDLLLTKMANADGTIDYCFNDKKLDEIIGPYKTKNL